MVLARISPVTAAAESLAAAVAAGILLGGFALGSVGLLAGQTVRSCKRALSPTDTPGAQ
jgi:hypothetical protein